LAAASNLARSDQIFGEAHALAVPGVPSTKPANGSLDIVATTRHLLRRRRVVGRAAVGHRTDAAEVVAPSR
jgi:hypothetical protein